MIKLTIKLLGLLMVVLAISCDSDNIETSRQLLAKEQERLNAFLNSVPSDSAYPNPDSLSVKDIWTQQAVDTVDKSLETGLIYFENVTGTGEVVSYGKEVGFRYFQWVIGVDEEGEVGMFANSSNYSAEDADYFVVGAASNALPLGIQQAAQYMRKYGKSRVVVPSTLGDMRYQTSVYDIEITYLK